MHREISGRARTVAPFLTLDNDPYLVIADGRLYSEKFVSLERIGGVTYITTEGKDGFVGSRFRNRNYVRNSVKIVIDAYNGNTDIYIFEEDDPLVQVYDRIFPGLLKKHSEIPKSLKKHVRYPADMLLLQGVVYAKYHMTDPTVFNNQKDLWVRATEKYYSRAGESLQNLQDALQKLSEGD